MSYFARCIWGCRSADFYRLRAALWMREKMKIRLDFCDFWPGFPKTDNFFYHLLRERFEVEICDCPDFLIFADIGQHVHRVHNCVKIHFCAEDFLSDFARCDYAFTCRQLDDPRHLRLPYYVLVRSPDACSRTTDELGTNHGRPRPGFAVSWPATPTGRPACATNSSTNFANTRKWTPAEARSTTWAIACPDGAPAKLEFLRPYKFNLAFENASVPGYTTEKIVDAMQARAMPIYWGNPAHRPGIQSQELSQLF